MPHEDETALSADEANCLRWYVHQISGQSAGKTRIGL